MHLQMQWDAHETCISLNYFEFLLNSIFTSFFFTRKKHKKNCITLVMCRNSFYLIVWTGHFFLHKKMKQIFQRIKQVNYIRWDNTNVYLTKKVYECRVTRTNVMEKALLLSLKRKKTMRFVWNMLYVLLTRFHHLNQTTIIH